MLVRDEVPVFIVTFAMREPVRLSPVPKTGSKSATTVITRIEDENELTARWKIVEMAKLSAELTYIYR